MESTRRHLPVRQIYGRYAHGISIILFSPSRTTSRQDALPPIGRNPSCRPEGGAENPTGPPHRPRAHIEMPQATKHTKNVRRRKQNHQATTELRAASLFSGLYYPIGQGRHELRPSRRGQQSPQVSATVTAGGGGPTHQTRVDLAPILARIYGAGDRHRRIRRRPGHRLKHLGTTPTIDMPSAI